jgi:hypothetical protein
MENKWDDIRELLLTYIKVSLEEGETADHQTDYWVSILNKFCYAEKTFFERQ